MVGSLLINWKILAAACRPYAIFLSEGVVWLILNPNIIKVKNIERTLPAV